ncbi:hypothetical protein ACPXCE_28955 [Streptomyces sp. DT24]|uniref:hypothetical protein n=1 Tax=unclassified Streptomyces TaxID=2593676 RepID=UPI0023B95FE1|nr:hypothetical protein [Streptomyces sp. AM 4-1-1]WEH33060.1 hypothetical protein PZB75_06515 [Streptomyces sp. AM 4-1-1]
MGVVLALLAGLLAMVLLLTVWLNRRGNSPTENFEGQEIERQRSAAVRETRRINNSMAVHSRLIDGGREARP